MTAIGVFLGSVYRAELAGRIRCGVLDRAGRAAWRAGRKRAVTAVSSSRWAGTITRAVEDQFQLGMRGLAAHVADLKAAVSVLSERCALHPGERSTAEAGHTVIASAQGSGRRGYRSAAERFTKTRRLAVLRGRLRAAEDALAEGRPSMVVGGTRLWRQRHNLAHSDMTELQWRQQWDAVRMFITADGEAGKVGGNETIRVDPQGCLRVKVPAALTAEFGPHVVIEQPVHFAYRGDEWAERVASRQAVRYDVHFDADRGRWYLDASWRTSPKPVPSLEELRAERVLGVDLNADHLACCVLDASGNPIGEPNSIEVVTAGLAALHRDGRVRAAIVTLLNLAQQHNCGAIVIENLGFTDCRATGRETLGRGKRGKRLRRTVAGIPTAKFRRRLIGMAARRGINVIGVDAAYTSRWGAQHWIQPLRQQTSDPTTVTSHHGAAAAIGRRGLGLAIRRRPAGPRTGQRTGAGKPPVRPSRHLSTTRRYSSSDPPTCPQRGVSVRRKTPIARGQHRSGRSEAVRTPAHSSGTVEGSSPSAT
ncbi:hypothetical protein BST20_11935 [Mycobacterium branderi]|uniref:Transposase n=3 Tax=Mycobacterium branderi TaxID=43348 RepID=A0AA91LYE5_9MYCO|nr:hypothetical protein BST20_11935 [Mycobacterium branderi]